MATEGTHPPRTGQLGLGDTFDRTEPVALTLSGVTVRCCSAFSV